MSSASAAVAARTRQWQWPKTLKSFFEAIGPERAAKFEAVTTDMSSAYIKAVNESVPSATLIFDRFHVQRLVHDALDEVRREEVRSASADKKTDLKKTRWPLQKRPWNLSDLENAKLADLEEKNRRIYRAYLLKESLAAILDGRQINVARRKLDEWLEWARSSGLSAFVRVAGTIEKHREGILPTCAPASTTAALKASTARPESSRAGGMTESCGTEISSPA